MVCSCYNGEDWAEQHFLTGDYYFIKAGNDLVSLGLAQCE